MSQRIDCQPNNPFCQLRRPHDIQGKEHLLLDTIAIALCAVISGAEG